MLGDVYSNKGDYDHAISNYNMAITYYPNSAEIYYKRGNNYLYKGDYEKAIADFNTVISLNPNNAPTYNSRGLAYIGNGNYDQAIADYNKAITINPNYAIAYFNRGNAYEDNKNYDGAISDFTKAIALDPNNAAAYSNRGLAYAYKGKYDRAIADCTKAIALDPNFAQAYYNRGRAYGNRGDLEKGIADLTRAVQLAPSNTGYKQTLQQMRQNAAKQGASQTQTQTQTNRGWLGVSLMEADQDTLSALGLVGQHGALAAMVFDNSPAEKAGIQPGDFIIAVNGREVNGIQQLQTMVGNLAVGDTAQFTLLRGGRVINTTATIEQLDGSTAADISKLWPGVYPMPLNDSARNILKINNSVNGVVAAQVIDKTPAAIVGLQTNDIITAVNGSSVTNVREFYDALRGVGQLWFTIQRGDSRLESPKYVRYSSSENQTSVEDYYDPEDYYGRGIDDYNGKHYKRAIVDFSNYIALNPNDAHAYFSRGDAYYYKGDYTNARADWEKVLQLEPNNADARKNLTALKGMGY
jgi:tetratricopeptide (TPR) repeat protein